MKNKSNKKTSEKKINNIIDAYSNRKKRKFIIAGVIAFCVVFSIVFLYQPARDFYISVRENDRLQAQYQAILKTNENLTKDIEQLQTEEGIKQRASDSLGLIENGEQMGYVSGSENTDGRENSANSTSSKLAYKNIKTPTTWYSPLLDFIFNFHD